MELYQCEFWCNRWITDKRFLIR